jgi:hypothetical protein
MCLTDRIVDWHLRRYHGQMVVVRCQSNLIVSGGVVASTSIDSGAENSMGCFGNVLSKQSIINAVLCVEHETQ